MSINEQFLAALANYGLPVLFGGIFLNTIGVPIPATILIITAGSFVQMGDMNLVWVVVLGTIGAILGDQVGYWVGCWGGRRLAKRISRWVGGEKRLQDAEAIAKKWGGPGIFLSRWLFTSLNTWVNLISGFTSYPYRNFLFWDISGEVVWVILCVILGEVFSDRVQALIVLLGNFVWIEIGLLAAFLFGWGLIKYIRNSKK